MATTVPAQNIGSAAEERTAPRRLAGVLGRDGWPRFALMLVSRGYLLVMATLIVVAVLPLLLGWRPMVILSGSMEPTVSPGDVVLVSDVPEGETYGEGMVIAFDTVSVEDQPVVKVHRITEVRDDGFVTQGDANADRDSGVRIEADVRGAGRLLVPFIGSPVYWMGHDLPALAAWLLATLVAVGLAVPPSPGPRRPGQATVAVLALAAVAAGSASPSVHAYAAFSTRTGTAASWHAAALPAIAPGRLAPFSLLAANSVTDGWLTFTQIAGDIGTTPGTNVTNVSFPDSHGAIEKNTAAARNAMTDARTLATSLEARPAAPRANSLTGRVTPGTYSAGALSASGTITLDAGGDSSARFVFIGSSLTVANNTNVVLANGASAANVYWRIRGGATLNTSTLRGTVLADGSITANTATLTGRLVSFNGSISASRYLITAP
ncbi:signal peptidase I [Microbacterium oryzae]|uniref:signal peptidase I n=1 Tax=Microbacterium oryzae TaxID=743009 RepID=UPI0025AFAB72|nr:signal peptidase I [Microbacterium oryzae]MDN3311135.1 signal peptidase I [Microbacterium oryzae]